MLSRKGDVTLRHFPKNKIQLCAVCNMFLKHIYVFRIQDHIVVVIMCVPLVIVLFVYSLVCVCVSLRSSSCSFPPLCCVVRSERPMLSSVTSALLPCAAFESCPHTRISSPSAARPRHPSHPSVPPPLKTAQPIKPWPHPHSQTQRHRRYWFQLRISVSRPVWWRSQSMAARCSRANPPSCLCGSEGQTRRESMK